MIYIACETYEYETYCIGWGLHTAVVRISSMFWIHRAKIFKILIMNVLQKFRNLLFSRKEWYAWPRSNS